MAVIDYKITQGEIDNAHVQKQDTILKGSPEQNKTVFDLYPELIKDHFNDFIDFVDGGGLPTGDEIKRAVYPVGTVIRNTTGVNPAVNIGIGTWVLLDGMSITLTRHGSATTKTLYFFERTV